MLVSSFFFLTFIGRLAHASTILGDTTDCARLESEFLTSSSLEDVEIIEEDETADLNVVLLQAQLNLQTKRHGKVLVQAEEHAGYNTSAEVSLSALRILSHTQQQVASILTRRGTRRNLAVLAVTVFVVTCLFLWQSSKRSQSGTVGPNAEKLEVVDGTMPRQMPVMLFLQLMAWVAFGNNFVCFADMVLREKCQALGVPEAVCNTSSSAQAATAGFLAWFTFYMNIAPFLTVPLLGHISDVVGRKPVLLLNVTQGLLIFLWFALRGVEGNVNCIVLFSLSFFGAAGGGEGILCAAVADSCVNSSESEKARFIGIAQTPMWMGQMLGPVLGGAVASVVGPQKSYLCSALLNAISLIVCQSCFHETLPTENRQHFDWRKANPYGVVTVLSKFPRSSVLALGYFFAEWGIITGVGAWPLFCKKMFSWSDAKIGSLQALFFMGNGIALIFMLPVMSKIATSKQIVLTAAACSIVMWSLFCCISSGWQMFAFLCMGFPTAVMHPVIRSCFATEFGKESYGVAMAVMPLAQQFVNVSAQPLLEGTWQWIQQASHPDSLVFVVPAVAYAMAFGIFQTLPSQGEEPTARAESS